MKKNHKNQKLNKNTISLNSIPQPHPRLNENKNQKKTFNDSSSHSISNIQSNNKHMENNFKDSLEGSISESKTNIFIPDSLNNTKSSIGNITKKKIPKKNRMNDSKNKNNISNNNLENDEKSSGKNNEESTKKIDYRFYTNYPIFIINNNVKSKEEEKNKYWLAVYDKLMNRKKLIKILNYYDKEINHNDINNNINEESIKEQLLIIKDFDIYFMKQSNKPFIKYIKGNCIFTKLYLLTVDQINLVLNYINRYKLSFTKNDIKMLNIKGNYQKLNENYKNFPYNMIYHMGNYMNISIYGFSNYHIQNNNISSYNYLNQKFPSSKKVAKLIKLLMINFPKYSFNFFVCYLLSKIRFENFNEKSNEIKNIIYSNYRLFLPLQNRYYNNDNIINNSILHSTYSPLSHYEDETSNKEIIKDYNEDNYQQILEKNAPFEYHTIENENKKKNNIIINNINKNKNKNFSEKKKNIRKHTESVYLNGYVGKENKLFFNKKSKEKKKEGRISIKQYINKFNIRPSLIIDEYKKNKKKLENININKNKSFNQKKIKFQNFIQLQKKNNKYIKNGIFNKKNRLSLNLETDKNYIMDEKDKNKSNVNQVTSKIIINTKSEETKIETTNKENKEATNYMNNSGREDINKENTGIFVVNKKMTTDINDYIDDEDSSVIINSRNINGQSSVFITPEKKKKYRYYS